MKFKTINEDTKILEVGTGSGWFPILCKKNDIFCQGLEISPKLVEYAQNLGRIHGVEPNIKLGNIEETDIGTATYDIIIALSIFEHVEYWQMGVKKIFKALRPEGLFYFYSTNKFSLWSGEYHFPFYGWLPNRWRYRLRISRQGKDIMKLGIDFHQFTHLQLRRFFKRIGFSELFDQFDVIDPDNLIHPRHWKKFILEMIKRFKPIKHILLFFSPGTLFICKK